MFDNMGKNLQDLSDKRLKRVGRLLNRARAYSQPVYMQPFAHFLVPCQTTETEHPWKNRFGIKKGIAGANASPVAPWFSKTPVIMVPFGNLAPQQQILTFDTTFQCKQPVSL